ncbi:MAG: membrane protein insertion efficiency factor YidD [Bacteroidetes bacterium QS_1_63_11]|nr:MAG: membrane protein insertion efficiency factor YidD [Bacteroidetes bacterium QS_1_63_11]
MRRALSFLIRLPRLLLVGLVRAYQLLLSPHLGRTCRFHPTCSNYAIQAVREYGVLKGLVLTVHRLFRCHPWGGHGYDPPRWFGDEEETSDASSSTFSPDQARPDS